MAKPLVIFSNWNTMIEGLDLSPKQFYAQLAEVIESKNVPDTKHMSVTWNEGGVLSAKRQYLRVRRKENAFDICCAPFGNGTFFSWWMGGIPSGFLAFLYALPILSWLAFFFEKFFKPDTYYKIDTMMMFQSLIHSAVLEVVDEHTKAKGLRTLSETDRKPKMKDIFNK